LQPPTYTQHGPNACTVEASPGFGTNFKHDTQKVRAFQDMMKVLFLSQNWTMNAHKVSTACRLSVYWGTVLATLWGLAYFYAYGTEKGREWYRSDVSDKVCNGERPTVAVVLSRADRQNTDKPALSSTDSRSSRDPRRYGIASHCFD
jgi:hypothetical protein